MPKRWADEPESGEQPKTDLNPLLNPVLEENLGRWAQVYFTNPPETRERAVMDLLRELENRGTPNREASNGGAASQTSESKSVAAPAVSKSVCSVCSRENREDQKFCGFCGTPIRPSAANLGQPANVPPANSDQSIGFAKAAAPLEPRESLGQASEPLSFLGLSSASDTELDSLRERSFDKSYYEPDSRHRGLYIAAALIILIGGVTYLTWPMLLTHLPLSWQEAVTRPPVHVNAAPRMAEPAPPVQPPAPLPATTEPTAQSTEPVEDKPAEAPTASPAEKTPPGATMASKSAPKAPAPPTHDPRAMTLASESQTSRVASDGTQELQQAQRYLKAGHSPTESSEAARWLWKSVGKQNSHAAVLLADLYVKGDGVSRNCDEARILLGAAAKRGLSEAAQKLSSLDSSCH